MVKPDMRVTKIAAEIRYCLRELALPREEEEKK
jgi:hypothetical protein